MSLQISNAVERNYFYNWSVSFSFDFVFLKASSTFLQGDILFLHMSKDPIRAGEIVVFNVDVSSA